MSSTLLTKAINRPAYRLKIRSSRRAKYLRINIPHLHEVVVTTPAGISQETALEFFHSKKSWVQNNLVQMAKNQPPEALTPYPDVIRINALDQRWQIQYYPAPHIRALVDHTQKILHVYAPTSPTAVYTVFRKWIYNLALRHLIPWFQRHSIATGIDYKQVRIRRQKSRWGSCSPRQVINLNCNLLFLPPEMVEYLFSHELCHTLHANHSAAFWRAVAKVCPLYLQHDRNLTRTHQYVPWWAWL